MEGCYPESLLDDLTAELGRAQAILGAIDEGELLSDAPAYGEAIRRHHIGTDLLFLLGDVLMGAQCKVQILRAGLDDRIIDAPSPREDAPH